MDLNISSININGFRSNYKHRLIKQFIEQNNIDILLMQETFVDNLRLAKSIEKTLELENKIIWNFGILLPRTLRHDPRFIQCIYRYSHASKRLVEV